MKNHTVVLLRVAVTMGVVTAGPVMAQTQQASQPESTSLTVLHVIIVTAQKRAENLQRVPITMTAFDARTMAVYDMTSVQDVEEHVPGFTLNSVAGGPVPSIRGLAVQSSGPWQEPAIAVYIDGVYYSNPTFLNMPLNNIEQVEVLKGPQGTLFGRNSIGGVLSFVTKDPQQAPSIDFTAGYGNYNTWSSSLYATTGITDNLAADIAVTAEDQQDGWGTNLYNNDKVATGYNYAVRSKWVLTLDDSTKITASANFGRSSTPQMTLAATRGVYPFITIGPSHVGGFYDVYDPTDPFNTTLTQGGGLKAEHDFGWARLASISAAHTDSNPKSVPYGGFVPPYLPETPGVGQIPGLKVASPSDIFQHTFTQEIQLLSPDASTIQWVTGLYYLYDNSGFLFDDTPKEEPAGIVTSRAVTSQKTNSYSGYAQITVPIFSGTRIVGGTRYTVDHRDITGYTDQDTAADPDVFKITGTSAANPQPSGTWSKATYRAVLEHDLGQNTLTYLSYSTGFQSAFYTLSTATAAPTQPQYITNYEAGLKTDLLDNRLRVDTSVFFYDLDNAVVQQLINGISIQANAAKVQAKGIDTDITATPARNLTVTVSFEYLDAIYSSYKNAIAYVPGANGEFATVSFDATGTPLQYAEKFMGTASANYVILTNSGNLEIMGSATYHSGMHFDTQDLNVQPSYALVNASLGWTRPDGQLGVKLWVKNLTNTEVAGLIASNTIMQYTPEAPRTFGIQVDYHWH